VLTVVALKILYAIDRRRTTISFGSIDKARRITLKNFLHGSGLNSGKADRLDGTN